MIDEWTDKPASGQRLKSGSYSSYIYIYMYDSARMLRTKY